MSDRIDVHDIIGQGVFDSLEQLTESLKEVKASLKEIHSENKAIEIKITGANGVKEFNELLKQQGKQKKVFSDLQLYLNEYNKLLSETAKTEAKLAVSESDAAKAAVAAKEALRERNKELRESVKLEKEANQTRREPTKKEARSLELQERKEALAVQKELERAEKQRHKEELERKKFQRSLDMQERKEALEVQKELQRVEKERQALEKANFANTQQFKDEAQALYDQVKARNEIAKSLRDEAAAKSLLAAQSADAVVRAQYEAEARQLLVSAQNEERANKQALAAANKLVANTVKDNIAAENMLVVSMQKLNAESERTVQDTIKKTNAYEQLKREYNEAAYATKTLAAELVLLERSGNASAATLTKLRKELKEQQAATLQQSNALLQMEQAIGQNQRAVGNYANATAEINQVLRELPNFAISAQTGILSLSNNLPMLQASLVRLKNTVDQNTGAALGWSGVMKTIVQSLFSWQTAIILVTTLMVAYGKEIWEMVSGLTEAEKRQKAYSDALNEAAASQAQEIGQIKVLTAALKDNTVSRTTQLRLINDVAEKYPELVRGIDAETAAYGLLNERLEQRIEMLGRAAEEQARQSIITEGTKELAEAQTKLNEQMGFFEKVWARRPWGGKPYDELNKSTQEAIDKQYALLKAGLISRAEYDVMYRRLTDVAKAQDNLTASVNGFLNPEQEKIDKINEEIKSKEALLKKIDEERKKIGDLTGVRAEQIKFLDAEIDRLNLLKKGYEDAAAARAKMDDRPIAPAKLTFNEIDLADLENRLKTAKKGSKELLDLTVSAARTRYAVTMDNLKKESALYKDSGEKNVWLMQQQAKAMADMQKEINDAQEAFARKSKTPKGVDTTRAEIKGQEDYNEAINDFARQRVATEMASNEAIFENEKKSLDERLAAYAEYVKGQQKLNVIDENSELTALQIRLDKIREIEKIDASKHTAAQKALLLDKEALLIQEQTLLEKFRLRQQQINFEAQKKEEQIIQNGIRRQVQLQTESYNALRDEARKETALRLAELNKQREEGTINEKAFWHQRRLIMASESQLLFDKELEFLKERKDEIIKQLSDPAISDADREMLLQLQKNLEEAFANLEMMRPDPKKTQKVSIMQYLGFDADNDVKELEASRQAYFRTIEDYDRQVVAAAEKLSDAKRQAAELYIAGSKEYNEAIKRAEKESASSLQQAGIIRDAAYQTYTDNSVKSINAAKQRLAKEIENVGPALLSAFSSVYDNLSKSKLDNLDKQSEAIASRLEEELMANEASLKSQKEKADEEARLRAKALADEKALLRQRRQIERDDAARRKRLAIFEASVNAGLAVSKAFTAYAAQPVVAAVIAALVAAQAAAQIAVIASQPMPAYWKGTPEGGHPGGPAMVGEKGVELVTLPSGKQFYTPNKPTVYDLPKGTEVMSNSELVKLSQREISKEISKAPAALSEVELLQLQMAAIEKALGANANQIVSAISKKPETQFTLINGELRKRTKIGNAWVEYLSRVV